VSYCVDCVRILEGLKVSYCVDCVRILEGLNVSYCVDGVRFYRVGMGLMVLIVCVLRGSESVLLCCWCAYFRGSECILLC
jgi:hypothetical protein